MSVYRFIGIYWSYSCDRKTFFEEPKNRKTEMIHEVYDVMRACFHESTELKRQLWREIMHEGANWFLL